MALRLTTATAAAALICLALAATASAVGVGKQSVAAASEPAAAAQGGDDQLADRPTRRAARARATSPPPAAAQEQAMRCMTNFARDRRRPGRARRQSPELDSLRPRQGGGRARAATASATPPAAANSPTGSAQPATSAKPAGTPARTSPGAPAQYGIGARHLPRLDELPDHRQNILGDYEPARASAFRSAISTVTRAPASGPPTSARAARA